jgi:hypothetical protein
VAPVTDSGWSGSTSRTSSQPTSAQAARHDSYGASLEVVVRTVGARVKLGVPEGTLADYACRRTSSATATVVEAVPERRSAVSHLRPKANSLLLGVPPRLV